MSPVSQRGGPCSPRPCSPQPRARLGAAAGRAQARRGWGIAPTSLLRLSARSRPVRHPAAHAEHLPGVRQEPPVQPADPGALQAEPRLRQAAEALRGQAGLRGEDPGDLPDLPHVPGDRGLRRHNVVVQSSSPAGGIWWWGRISRGWNPCGASAARAVLGWCSTRGAARRCCRSIVCPWCWGCGGDPALPGQRWGTAGSWADPEPSLPLLSFSTRSLAAFTASQIRGLEAAAGGDRKPSVRPQPTRIPPRPRLSPCCGLLCCRSPGTS